MELFDRFKLELDARPNEKNMVTGDEYRITVITDRLFRIETSTNNLFVDHPTQRVWYRDFGAQSYEVEDTEKKLVIRTAKATLEFSKNTKFYRVTLQDDDKVFRANRLTHRFGNLKGTKRTLDMAFGAVKLGRGILSKRGITVFDDSRSLLLRDGMLHQRNSAGKDLYVFAYGDRYQDALDDFYKITGRTPLIPRYAFGNWWSRYWEYSDKEYLSLMHKFRQKNIPFSVATIDMDWHLVNLPPENGKKVNGWTGYTWNRALFPDPEEFLNILREMGYKTTLNLHPADGIRHFEECYPKMAEYMGINPASKTQIQFDLTDPRFINGYFEIAHHPHEQMGVDFWWIDWQQGTKSKVNNLDPLWLLNHYHTIDIGRDGRRPLILSRYAGIGSHRYQIGFSGDTQLTWGNLRFQPYFTATASNVGFTWWSHDIGGHGFLGDKDSERYVRWVQLGAFSPILRLHSTKNKFIDKDPTKFREDIGNIATDFLRLRHRLIPYIYTMNFLTHTENIPLIRPLYYHDQSHMSYQRKYRNNFYFGSELLVAPITRKMKSAKKPLAYTDVCLPEGIWTDIFTGYQYKGGRALRMYRDLGSIPVLAKEGAILVMDAEIRNETDNPEYLEIGLYPGQENTFMLYEDGGEDMRYLEGDLVTTEMVLEGDRENFTFTVRKPEGNISLIPETRKYKIILNNITDATIRMTRNGEECSFETMSEGNSLVLVTESGCLEGDVVLHVADAHYHNFQKSEFQFEILDKLEMNVIRKGLYLKWAKFGFMKQALAEADDIYNMIADTDPTE